MIYACFKFFHVLGIVLLVGNVTVTAVWKVFADRTQDPTLVSFAQRLVTLTDWSFTVGGVLLTAGGGYGMVWLAAMDPLTTPWLLMGQLLFLASGLIWIGVLVPIQCAQARISRGFKGSEPIPSDYRNLGMRWIFWGIAATVPLVAATAVMIFKPSF